LNAGRRRGAVTRGIEPPVRPSQGGLYRERLLPFETAHRRADREELWCLIGRHVPEDRAVERAGASLEAPFLPHAQEGGGEQTVEVAVRGELVVLAAGNEEDRGAHGRARIAFDGVLELVVHDAVSPIRSERDLARHVAVPDPLAGGRPGAHGATLG